MNSHQRRKFVKAAMSELRGACQSEPERGLVDAAEVHVKQEKRIDLLEQQIATLTRQRDLAVEALTLAGPAYFGMAISKMDPNDENIEELRSIGIRLCDLVPDSDMSIYDSLMLVDKALSAKESGEK